MHCIHTFTYHLYKNVCVYMCVCLGRQALLKHLRSSSKHRCMKNVKQMEGIYALLVTSKVKAIGI